MELAHVRDVEDAAVAAHRTVLRDDALVLDGHLPARRTAPCALRLRRDVRGAAGARGSARRDCNDCRKHDAPASRGVENQYPKPTGQSAKGACATISHALETQTSRVGSILTEEKADLELGVGRLVARTLGNAVRHALGDRSLESTAPLAVAEAGSDHGHRTSSPSESSITAPKMTFAFWSAAPVTTSAASFTSKTRARCRR